MVDGRRLADEGANELRVAQVADIPNERRRIHPIILLIELVVAHEVPMVLGDPALVRVARSRVPHRADHRGVGWVCDVDDGHGVLVAAERNFLALVIAVWTDVRHDLGVVGVSVARVIADEGRIEGVADVQNVQSPRKGGGTHPIGAARALVDHDVVGVSPSRVEGIRLDVLRRIVDAAQLGQIHHLHAMSAGLRDNERMVVVDFDVAPK